MKTNRFIAMIYEKQEFSWKNFFKYHKHIRQLRKFKNMIYKGSPDFWTLWEMSDFIKFAEDAFFYDNSLSNSHIGLYSSRNYKPNENGFKITNSPYSDKCNIIVKLSNINDSQKVTVEVDRLVGSNTKSILQFKNNQWIKESDNTDVNEIILDNVIDIINTCILQLFNFCYNNRFLKRYDEL